MEYTRMNHHVGDISPNLIPFIGVKDEVRTMWDGTIQAHLTGDFVKHNTVIYKHNSL
jgi:hypothetical protein